VGEVGEAPLPEPLRSGIVLDFSRHLNRVLSVDAEGFDERILKSLDFEKFRPKVICVETLEPGTGKVIQSIVSFLEAKDYSMRGSTFVNSVFLDNSLMESFGHKA
jgi:hypothetical protein